MPEMTLLGFLLKLNWIWAGQLAEVFMKYILIKLPFPLTPPRSFPSPSSSPPSYPPNFIFFLYLCFKTESPHTNHKKQTNKQTRIIQLPPPQNTKIEIKINKQNTGKTKNFLKCPNKAKLDKRSLQKYHWVSLWWTGDLPWIQLIYPVRFHWRSYFFPLPVGINYR